MGALYLQAVVPVLLLLVATFVFAGVAAGSNAYQIGRNYDVSHTWESRERLATLLGYAVLVFAADVLAGHWPVACVSVGLGFAGCLCLFGLRFDIRLNLRRLLNRFYLGTDPQTAAQDKAVRKSGLTGQQWAWLKLAGVLLLSAGLLFLRIKMLQAATAGSH